MNRSSNVASSSVTVLSMFARSISSVINSESLSAMLALYMSPSTWVGSIRETLVTFSSLKLADGAVCQLCNWSN